MLILSPASLIVAESVRSSLASEEKSAATLCDFDGVTYRVESTGKTVVVRMTLPCFQELSALGAMKVANTLL